MKITIIAACICLAAYSVLPTASQGTKNSPTSTVSSIGLTTASTGSPSGATRASTAKPPDATKAGTAKPPDATKAGTAKPPDATKAGTAKPPDATKAGTAKPPDATKAGTPKPPDATKAGTAKPPDATKAGTPKPPDATKAGTPKPPDATKAGTPKPPDATKAGTAKPPDATKAGTAKPPDATKAGTAKPPDATKAGTAKPPDATKAGTAKPPDATKAGTAKPPDATKAGTAKPPDATKAGTAKPPDATKAGTAKPPDATKAGTPKPPDATKAGTAKPPDATKAGTPKPPDATKAGTAKPPDATKAGTAKPPDATKAGTAKPPDATKAGTAKPPDATKAGTAKPPGATKAGTAKPPDATKAGTAKPPDATKAGTAKPPDATKAGTAKPPDATKAGTAKPPDATKAGTASPSGVTKVGTASPSGVTKVGTASPSGVTKVGTASYSGVTKVGTASPSGVTKVGTASPTGVTKVGTASPSGVTRTATANPSGVTRAGTASSSGVTRAGTASLSGIDQTGETSTSSAVETAMKENAEFKIPFSLSVNTTFTKELKNRYSTKFLEYEREFKTKIWEAFSKKPEYIDRIIIIDFRAGSVVCDYEAVFPANVEANDIINYVNTTVKEALQNQTIMDAPVDPTYLKDQMVADLTNASKKLSDKCNAENVCPVGFKCLSNKTTNHLCMDMCHDLNCGKHGTCERSKETVFCKCHQDADTEYVYGGDQCQIKGEKLKLSSKYIAIIAGTVGGGVIFILFIALTCMCYRNRRAKATRDGPLSAAGQSFSLEALDRRAGQGMEQNETNLSRYPNPNGNIYSPMQTGPHELDKEDSSLYNGYGQQPRLPYNNLEMSRPRGHTLDEGRNSALMYFPSPGLPKGGIGLGNRTSYTGEPQQVQQPDYTSFGKNSDDRDLDDGLKVYRQERFQLPRLTAKSISEPSAEDRINESNCTSIDRHRDESRGSFYNRGNDGRERFESVIRPDKPPRSIENRGKIEEPEVRRYRHDETSSTHSGHKQSSVAMTADYYNPRADYDDIDDDRRLLDDFEQRRQHAGVRNNAYVAGVDERRAESRTRPSQRAHHGNEQYYRGSRDR